MVQVVVFASALLAILLWMNPGQVASYPQVFFKSSACSRSPAQLQTSRSQ